MKRFLLLFSGLLLGSSVMFGQLNIYVTGHSHIMNDSTVDVFGAVNTAHIEYLYVTNPNGIGVTVKAKYIVATSVASAQNSFCWGTQCYGANSAPYFESNTSDVIGPHRTDSTFSGHYYDNGSVGTESVRYTFMNVSDTADSASIIVKYDITPLGIQELNRNALHISAPYPNPAKANATFNYQLNGMQQATLQVYNTLGQCVRTIVLNSENDRYAMDVNAFPTGLYICKLEATGVDPVFQKLIVTH